VQGISRTLWEEVKFNNKNVTSVDWQSYPILDIAETPEAIDVVGRKLRRQAPASRRSARLRRRSPMPCSTRPACASGGYRSRPTM
jgi:hypothetical protein